LIGSNSKYFFFPLQLNSDAQLERNSPFGTMRKAIEHVLASFARHAPRETRLVVKNHPLDTGLAGYRRQVADLEHLFDLKGRIDYLETGELAPLFDHAQGVVTVNSTAGLSALQHRRPTKALGRAVYDLPRLTFQGGLDDFWRAAWSAAPDMEVVRAFRNVLVHGTQVNGGFYTAKGIDALLPGCERLLEPRSRLEDLLERFPSHASQAAPAAEWKTPARS
jgi:capsular polysaccharide export protein